MPNPISDAVSRMNPPYTIPDPMGESMGQAVGGFVQAYVGAKQRAQELRQHHDLEMQKLDLERQKTGTEVDEHKRRMGLLDLKIKEQELNNKFREAMLAGPASDYEHAIGGTMQALGTDDPQVAHSHLERLLGMAGIPSPLTAAALGGTAGAMAPPVAAPSPIGDAAAPSDPMREMLLAVQRRVPPGDTYEPFPGMRIHGIAPEKPVSSAILNAITRNAEMVDDDAIDAASTSPVHAAALKRLRDRAIEAQARKAELKEKTDEEKEEHRTLRMEMGSVDRDIKAKENALEDANRDLADNDKLEPRPKDLDKKTGEPKYYYKVLGRTRFDEDRFGTAKDAWQHTRNVIVGEKYRLSKQIEALKGHYDDLKGQLVPDEKPVEPTQTPGAPKIGSIEDGYRFIGGDPADQKSWQKVK